MPFTTEQLREGLRDFRSRAKTIDDAVSEGSVNADAAIALLGNRNEAVRWSAIKILSDVGEHSAVEPLIGLLERHINVMDAANALRRITGQKFGLEPDAWRGWLSGGADAEVESVGLAEGEMLNLALKDLPVSVSGSDGQYAVDVDLGEGRSQRVWLDFTRQDPEGRALIQLCTACGDVQESRYEWALKLNMTIPYGAVGIAKLGDMLCFAMVDSYLRETADPIQIGQSLMTLARRGDKIEKTLGGEERF